MSIQQEKFKEIADAIRECLSRVAVAIIPTGPIKPSEFANKIYEVFNYGCQDGYNAGYNIGYAYGSEDGYEEGYNDSLDDIEESYNRGYDEAKTVFWNGIQDNGARTDYQQAFRNWKNADKYWKPTHNIQSTTYSYTFYACDMNGASLPELCEQAGIILDFSKSTNANQCFSYCNISDVGTIDARNWTNSNSLLLYAQKTKKAHIILRDDGSQNFNGAFTGATSLTDLTIEGAIGKTLPIPSPLTPESMISVITHLVNYKGTANEGVNTITFTDACWEALEAHSTAPNGDTWRDYVYTLGWTC